MKFNNIITEGYIMPGFEKVYGSPIMKKLNSIAQKYGFEVNGYVAIDSATMNKISTIEFEPPYNIMDSASLVECNISFAYIARTKKWLENVRIKTYPTDSIVAIRNLCDVYDRMVDLNGAVHKILASAKDSEYGVY